MKKILETSKCPQDKNNPERGEKSVYRQKE